MAGLVGVGLWLLIIGSDTARIFRDEFSDAWYWSLPFVVVQAIFTVEAFLLAVLAIRKARTGLSLSALTITAIVAANALTSVYYLIVVSHFGYGASW